MMTRGGLSCYCKRSALALALILMALLTSLDERQNLLIQKKLLQFYFVSHFLTAQSLYVLFHASLNKHNFMLLSCDNKERPTYVTWVRDWRLDNESSLCTAGNHSNIWFQHMHLTQITRTIIIHQRPVVKR